MVVMVRAGAAVDHMVLQQSMLPACAPCSRAGLRHCRRGHVWHAWQHRRIPSLIFVASSIHVLLRAGGVSSSRSTAGHVHVLCSCHQVRCACICVGRMECVISCCCELLTTLLMANVDLEGSHNSCRACRVPYK